MERTRLFSNGRSQAVRIPKRFRFEDEEEVYVNRIGDSLIVTPSLKLAESFETGLRMFTDDFMAEPLPNEIPAERNEMG